MHRDHHLRLEITRHRQPSHLWHLTIGYRADRHQDDVWMIKLLDQSHVAENPGIALVVNRAAIRKLKHITDRPPARLAAMHCRHTWIFTSPTFTPSSNSRGSSPFLKASGMAT